MEKRATPRCVRVRLEDGLWRLAIVLCRKRSRAVPVWQPGGVQVSPRANTAVQVPPGFLVPLCLLLALCFPRGCHVRRFCLLGRHARVLGARARVSHLSVLLGC